MKFNPRYLTAAACSFASFTLWVGDGTFIKLSGETLTIPQQATIGLSVSTLIVLLAAFLRGESLRELKTKKPFFHIGRGITNLINMLGAYYAITRMPLANFYAIAFTLPLMVAASSAFFLKERAGPGVWAAIGIGFGGVVIALNINNYDVAAWPWEAVMCILLANAAAVFYVITIKRGGKTESETALAFYPDIIVAIICLGIITVTNDWPSDPKGVMYIVLAGAMSGAATVLYVTAYRISHKNALIAPFHYTQIIAGSLIGYLIWGDIPTMNLLIGVTVIIAAGLYVINHGVKNQEATEAPL